MNSFLNLIQFLHITLYLDSFLFFLSIILSYISFHWTFSESFSSFLLAPRFLEFAPFDPPHIFVFSKRTPRCLKRFWETLERFLQNLSPLCFKSITKLWIQNITRGCPFFTSWFGKCFYSMPVHLVATFSFHYHLRCQTISSYSKPHQFWPKLAPIVSNLATPLFISQSEPAPARTPCRKDNLWTLNTFSLYSCP